jgi:hypothetical protein
MMGTAHWRRLALSSLAAVAAAFTIPAATVPSAIAGDVPGSACRDARPFLDLPAGPAPGAGLSPQVAAAAGEYKAGVDAGQADIQGALAISPSISEKLRRMTQAARVGSVSSFSSFAAMQAACAGAAGGVAGSSFGGLGAGVEASSGAGYAWIDSLNQQGQINSYYCGPATISESSTSVGHAVSQSTAGSYMGTNSNGTGTTQETAGMQQFVGYPVRGWSWYAWVSVPYTPSSSDTSTFESYSQYDIGVGMPVAGDAWEVVGGPHLVGHPNQQIFHYFEVGGYDSYGANTYYADSATSVWSTVPPYSWYDTNTLVVILGGRGYIW